MLRPRNTKFFQKQLELAKQSVIDAWAVPRTLGAWESACDAYEDWKLHLAAGLSESEKKREFYLARLDDLVQLLEEQAPLLLQMFGSRTPDWLEAFFLTALHLPVPDEMARKIDHFGPDNPLELQPDGSLRNHEQADMRHFQQLIAYHRSLNPKPRLGRPPKNLEMAEKAHRLDMGGKSIFEIGQFLFPDADHYDKKERDKIRKRVTHLIDRGQIESDRGSSETPPQ